MFTAVYPWQPKSGDHPKAHQRGNRSAKSGLLIQRAIHNSGDGNGTALQFSRLENPMDGGAWRATDHGAARVGHNLATITTTTISFGLPRWLSGKESPCNAGAAGWIPGQGTSPGVGRGNPP